MKLRPGVPVPITVCMLRDWHVGSGNGEVAGVDATVRRRHGQPYVPASTLTAMLAEGTWLAAKALGADWLTWVHALFGTTRDDPLLVAHPAMPEGEVSTADRAATAISTTTGTAEPGSLRLTEVVGPCRLSTSLLLTPDVTWSEPQLDTASLLVTLGCGLVDAVGAGRRRGLGEARLLALKPEDIVAARDLTSGGLPSPPRRLPATLGRAGPVQQQAPPLSWFEVQIRLDVEQPVLAFAGARGNQLLGHDRLPGGLLLPWAAARLSRLGVDPGSWVAGGALLCTDTQPGMVQADWAPAPLALLRDKTAAGQRVTNGLFDASNGRSLTGGHVRVDDPPNRAFRRATRRARFMHNAVNVETQTVTAEDGLYTLETLDEEQVLGASVWLRSDLVAALPDGRGLEGIFSDPEARLGAKAKSEDGAVGISVMRIQEHTGAVAPAADAEATHHSLVVLLTSDCLVRSETLRYSADPADLVRLLVEHLNLPPGTAQRAADKGVSGLFARTVRRDGWHARAGLPRPSLPAIAAGTTIRLEWEGDPPDPAGLRRLEIEGLGDRRAEGFGRIQFDPVLLQSRHIDLHEDQEDSLEAAPEPASPPREVGAPGPTGTFTGSGRPRGPSVQWRGALEVDLFLRSDLHVGATEPAILAEGDPAHFVRRADGTVMVPGTTLAGVLAQQARRRGMTDLTKGLGSPDLASAVSCLDATVDALGGAPGQRMANGIPVRSGVGIDRITGASASGVLAAREVLPAGSRITVRLSVRSASDPTVLLTQLAQLCASDLRLGHAISGGMGRTKATAVRRRRPVEVTSADGLLAWAANTWDTRRVDPLEPLPTTLITASWQPVVGMLVAADEPRQLSVGGQENEVVIPRLKRNEKGSWVPYLSGESIKGALRTRVGRITRTILGEEVPEQELRLQLASEPALLRALFGSVGGQAPLDIEDVECLDGITAQTAATFSNEPVNPPAVSAIGRPRTHVALDDWHRGPVRDSLFTVLSADKKKWQPVHIALDEERLGEGAVAALILLLVALAELAAGSLQWGGRTNRGLGAVHLTRLHVQRASGEMWTADGNGKAMQPDAVLHIARELAATEENWVDRLEQQP